MNTWMLSMLMALSLVVRPALTPAAPAKPQAGAALPGAPTAAVLPVATAAPTGLPASGGISLPLETLPGGDGDLGMLLLMMAAIFACIGLFRGSRREIPAFFGTVLAYIVVTRAWHLISRLVNLAWRMFDFAILRRGVMAENPGQAWSDASGTPSLLPVAGNGLRLAQMLLFAVVLVAIYAATRRHAEPNVIERLIGAVVASVTGYVVGVFMLSRMLPNAPINLMEPGEVALRWIQTLGPMAGLVLVAAVIVLGWRALGPKGFTKRYG